MPSTSRDRPMSVDLERQLKFHLTSGLRPDIILVSEATKHLVLLELTVPWEGRLEEAQDRKRWWKTRCCQWRGAVGDSPATP